MTVTPFAVSYHDYIGEPESISVELVTEHEGRTPRQGPYYRVRVGDLTLYLLEPRLRELQDALAMAPSPKVSAESTSQSAIADTAQ